MSLTTLFLFISGMFVIGFADLTIKEASGKITPSVGTLVYAMVTVIPPLLWTIWTRLHGPVVITREGVLWSIGTGLSFGVFTGLTFLLYARGVNLSVGSPVVRMGGIVVASALGLWVFREGLNLQYLVGFALAIIGIALVVLH